MSARPITANKAVKLLPHMYRLTEGWSLAPEGRTPCRSVEKYPERSRERFLTDAELTRLGQVLDRAARTGARRRRLLSPTVFCAKRHGSETFREATEILHARSSACPRSCPRGPLF